MKPYRFLCNLALLFFILSSSLIRAQVQVGLDIVASEPNDATGNIVTLSADGTILAVGAYFYGPNNEGQVRVYSLQSGEWTQLGQSFEGQPFGRIGGRLQLSGDGQRLIMNNGSIKVYQFSGGNWVQTGQTLTSDTPSDGFGSQVAISYTGEYLAVGASSSDVAGNNFGAISVFRLIGATWTKVGEDILGPSDRSRMGEEIAISDDGQTVICGMEANSDVTTFSGKAQVFRYDGSEWAQLGQDINGIGAWDFLGSAVDISGDGSIIGVTTRGENETCIYSLVNNVWVKMGDCLGGGSSGESYETSVALSFDGTIVAASSRNTGVDFNRLVGKAALFQYDGTQWKKVGSEVYGDQQDDYFGTSLALSEDGSFMAVGATRNLAGGTRLGFIRVFDMSMALPVDLLSFSAVPSGKSAKLDWVTASEFENEKFIVEHSDDAQNWTKIGEVFSQATGNASEELNYRFVHATPSTGINYYRLLQVDFSGDQVYSDIETVNFSTGPEVRFYPNPTRDFLNFESVSSLPIREVSIYRLNGQLVRTLPGAIEKLFVGDLHKGSYFVNFMHGADNESRKFTIE